MTGGETFDLGKSQPHVALFYSRGPHFMDGLQSLRAMYPDAEIAAIIPGGVQLSKEERDLIQSVVLAESGRYVLAEARKLMHLLGEIRRARYDLFTVMFPSPKLRLLAAFSGAANRACIHPKGRIERLSKGPVGILADETARRIKGWFVYLKMWVIVRVLPVRSR